MVSSFSLCKTFPFFIIEAISKTKDEKTNIGIACATALPKARPEL